VSLRPAVVFSGRRAASSSIDRDSKSIRRRLIFNLQTVVLLRRQGILSRTSAPSSSAWWRRRGERIGPSGFVPGSGVCGSLVKMQVLRRRTTLQSRISF
jgi:hypothetical protein